MHKKLYFYTHVRAFTKFLQRYYNGLSLDGCEVGVSAGVNSKNMCAYLNINKLYCVDSYCNSEQGNFKNHKLYARKLLQCYPVTWLYFDSVEAASKIIDDSLDFVYIDASHKYPDVKNDINNYYPKVKHGGVVGGHDYCSAYKSVIKAVDEFAVVNSLDVSSKSGDWWIVKEKLIGE